MENAKYMGNGMIYSALNFSRLSEGELEYMRRLLQCPECGGPAFFRKGSSSVGRAACFGARPHAHGCGISSQDIELQPNGADENQEALGIPHGRIVVDFGYGSPAQTDQIDDAVRTGCFPNKYHQHDSQVYRRPSSLLRLLVGSPAFLDSGSLIDVHGVSGVPPKGLFVPLLSVTEQYAGRFRGYWGMLSGAGCSKDKTTIWFNSGGLDTISFCMSTIHSDEFIRRYRIRDWEDIAGAYILVFGTLKVSPNGKLYCVIEEPNFMALRLT